MSTKKAAPAKDVEAPTKKLDLKSLLLSAFDNNAKETLAKADLYERRITNANRCAKYISEILENKPEVISNISFSGNIITPYGNPDVYNVVLYDGNAIGKYNRNSIIGISFDPNKILKLFDVDEKVISEAFESLSIYNETDALKLLEKNIKAAFYKDAIFSDEIPSLIDRCNFVPARLAYAMEERETEIRRKFDIDTIEDNVPPSIILANMIFSKALIENVGYIISTAFPKDSSGKSTISGNYNYAFVKFDGGEIDPKLTVYFAETTCVEAFNSWYKTIDELSSLD